MYYGIHVKSDLTRNIWVMYHWYEFEDYPFKHYSCLSKGQIRQLIIPWMSWLKDYIYDVEMHSIGLMCLIGSPWPVEKVVTVTIFLLKC